MEHGRRSVAAVQQRTAYVYTVQRARSPEWRSGRTKTVKPPSKPWAAGVATGALTLASSATLSPNAARGSRDAHAGTPNRARAPRPGPARARPSPPDVDGLLRRQRRAAGSLTACRCERTHGVLGAESGTRLDMPGFGARLPGVREGHLDRRPHADGHDARMPLRRTPPDRADTARAAERRHGRRPIDKRTRE